MQLPEDFDHLNFDLNVWQHWPGIDECTGESEFKKANKQKNCFDCWHGFVTIHKFWKKWPPPQWASQGVGNWGTCLPYGLQNLWFWVLFQSFGCLLGCFWKNPKVCPFWKNLCGRPWPPLSPFWHICHLAKATKFLSHSLHY